ncbi:amino acid ABC transporter [Klebsiella grimontii]|nr:amino acid ABC transporter [Klebsiella grimontii]
MMTTFTDWDIVRNLLLAGRWTVMLSLVAFLGGALVTLPLLLLRMTGGRQVKRLIRGYIELFQGTPLLMQLFLAFFGVALFGIDVSAWTAASLALTLYTSAFLLDILVRQHSRPAKRAVGSVALSGAELWPDAVSRRRAAGAADRHRPDGRLCRAGDQGHGAGVDYRLRRADQSGHHADQRHLSAV